MRQQQPGRLRPEIRELCVPFAGLPSLIGRSFLGDWFVVDAGSLPLFDQAIYTDRNPYPLDAGGYPEDLVEGFHLLALLDHLVKSAAAYLRRALRRLELRPRPGQVRQPGPRRPEDPGQGHRRRRQAQRQRVPDSQPVRH